MAPPLGHRAVLDCHLAQCFTSAFAAHFLLTGARNPLLSVLDPTTTAHRGLWHTVLYLSATFLNAAQTEVNFDSVDRQAYHGGRAFRLLIDDLDRAADASISPDHGGVVALQSLVLCLQAVHDGNRSGQYRIHLDAMKRLVADGIMVPSPPVVHTLLHEFALYYDYCSSFTSAMSPFDAVFRSLRRSLQGSASRLETHGNFMGVLDGLFEQVPRIRRLRDDVRTVRNMYGSFVFDFDVFAQGRAIDSTLRGWECPYDVEDPRYPTALLYRASIWIYLYRTAHASRPSPTLTEAVDQALACLQGVPESMQNALLTPLFLIGCASWESRQRVQITNALEQLGLRRGSKSVGDTRQVVEAVWGKMDRDDEMGSWDWERAVSEFGWDFVVV